ncbi:MAG: hypothetical protein ACE5JQ_13100 [Candidatus Methylomirabilales bacterium]
MAYHLLCREDEQRATLADLVHEVGPPSGYFSMSTGPVASYAKAVFFRSRGVIKRPRRRAEKSSTWTLVGP